MPNSSWTETGASIDLVPVTTPVQDAAQESPDYLTNSDKIALMAQYSAEISTKTQLDSTAASLSVSSTAYDNAVAAISTGLIAAGAPANWATIWPDGTTSGPWTGIQNSLGNWWSQVATQRAALQTSISSQQSANAQAAATAAAATDATNKMNTAVSIAAPIVVSGLPALPSTTYPNGKVVWNSADNKLYKSTGSAWVLLSVDAANLVANSITAGQIAAGAVGATQIAAGAITAKTLAVCDWTNLCYNPGFEDGLSQWSVTLGSASIGSGARSGNNALVFASGSGTSVAVNANRVPCKPGDSFLFGFFVAPTGNTFSGYVSPRLTFYDASGTFLSYAETDFTPIYGSWNFTSVTATAPANTASVEATIVSWGPSGADFHVDDCTFRRCADASLIVDGSITTAKINAGGISADVIKTGTLDASVVTVSNLNASNITTGTLSASKVLFPDGSALTTASRVSSAVYNASGSASSTAGAVVAIPGLTFSVTVASTADSFTIFGNFLGTQTAGTAGDTCFISLYVDGALNQEWGTMFSTLNKAENIPLTMLLTGLSAGQHTIDFRIRSTGASDTFNILGGGRVLYQRVF